MPLPMIEDIELAGNVVVSHADTYSYSISPGSIEVSEDREMLRSQLEVYSDLLVSLNKKISDYFPDITKTLVIDQVYQRKLHDEVSYFSRFTGSSIQEYISMINHRTSQREIGLLRHHLLTTIDASERRLDELIDGDIDD